MSIRSRLYRGEQEIDFLGRQRIGFVISGVLLLAGMLSLAVQGLDFSIEFEGGIVWEAPADGLTVAEVREEIAPLGLGDATIQRQRPVLGGTGETTIRVAAGADAIDLDRQVAQRLADLTGSDVNDVAINEVGPSWGEEVSRKAQRALVFFLIAVAVYISLRFEWKMAAGALAAVVHDVLFTVGIYSLFGFTVSPATVIAFLTILGYSLYDTVVVFDKVEENVAGLSTAGGSTYSGAVNRSLNQVLMRSVNTSFTSILPVVSILLVGTVLLGAETLRDFAVALLVGMLVGAYSSIAIAAPALAALKEREPRYAGLRQRLESRSGPVADAAGEARTAATLQARGRKRTRRR